jgi:Polyketide cyclase / dehydrase and lipid transport
MPPRVPSTHSDRRPDRDRDRPATGRRGRVRLRPGQRDELVRKHRGREWETPKPLAVGSRVAFIARFLGRRLAYTYEVRELVPGERLVMATSAGPLPMETTYAWVDAGAGTKMTLRNRGEPSGLWLAAPLMAPALRRANRKDLERLRTILERRD